MRNRLLFGLVGVVACVTAGAGHTLAATTVNCLKPAEVGGATGLAISSLQPVNEGIKVECLYSGGGKQVVVVYAVGQPLATFVQGEHATAGATPSRVSATAPTRARRSEGRG
jgi:hypothetical protein